jgi:hypothetical protein
MSLAAREVLTDCELAHEMLEAEQDEDRWRVLWAGAVALLRVVGHVLHKVDCQDPNWAKMDLNAIVDASFDRWKLGIGSDLIFPEFIERERNNILKEYKSSFDTNTHIPLVPEGGSLGPEIFEIETDLFRPLTDGFGEGEDARDIYAEAVDWWDSELTKIEELATGRK